jgi:hypothetical protein
LLLYFLYFFFPFPAPFLFGAGFIFQYTITVLLTDMFLMLVFLCIKEAKEEENVRHKNT